MVSGLTTEFKAYWTPTRLRQNNARWRAHGGGLPDEIIEELSAVLIRPEMTYENILGYLEAQFVRHAPGAEHYHGLYTFLISIVYGILWSRHVQLEPFIVQYLRYLDGIAGLAEENAPLWVFTLNHDLVVECVALSNGVPLTSGLPDIEHIPRRDGTGKKIGTLSLEVLRREELVKSGLRFYAPGNRGINLLKIHGGIDLFTFHDGQDLARIRPAESTVKALIEALRASHHDLVWIVPNSGVRFSPPNEEAYEDDNGEVQFLRHTLLAGAFKYDRRHQQTLPEIFLPIFKDNLSSLKHLICIGYGFGDVHINLILRGWLEGRSDRSLKIISPEQNGVPAPLMHLSPQVELTAMKATDFLQQYSLAPLTDVEIEDKARLDRERSRWS